eukprot:6482433-Amphidinium_carterae.2
MAFPSAWPSDNMHVSLVHQQVPYLLPTRGAASSTAMLQPRSAVCPGYVHSHVPSTGSSSYHSLPLKQNRHHTVNKKAWGSPGLQHFVPPPSAVTMPSLQKSHDLALQLATSYVSQRKDHEFSHAYRAVLQALTSWGFVHRLPLSQDGVLQVNVPFCHSFHEAPDLLCWLAQDRIGETSNARKVMVDGCDVQSQEQWWEAWQAWAQHE